MSPFKSFVRVEGRKFDSAKARVRVPTSLPGIGDLEGQQTFRPVHMTVVRRLLVVVWPTTIAELHIPTLSVPACSTNASCVRQVLDFSKQVIDEQIILNEILDASRVGGCLDGADGAFSNVAYSNFNRRRMMDAITAAQNADCAASSKSLPGRCRAMIGCGNHANRSVENKMKTSADPDNAMSQLTSLVSLLRSGGYHLRFLSAALVTVLDHLDTVVGEGELPPDAMRVSALLKDQFFYYRKRFTDAVAGDAGPQAKAKILEEQLRADWNKMLPTCSTLDPFFFLVNSKKHVLSSKYNCSRNVFSRATGV